MYYPRLRDLREDADKTQKEIAALLGIDQSDYSKIESGKRYFTFEQCKRIAVALETSMDYLAGLTDEKKALSPQAVNFENWRCLPWQHPLWIRPGSR